MNTPPGDSDPECLHLAVRVEAPFRADLEGSEVLAAGHVPGDSRAVDAGGHQRAQDNAHVDHAAGLDLREAPGDTEPGKGCFPHGLFHWDQGTPGEGAQFCPTHPTMTPKALRVSWTFYSTVIPEAMRVSWTFHPTVTPKVLRVSWTFHPSHPTVIPKATSISQTFHPPHPTVTPTPILYSMWESWALPEGETGLWIPWDESRLWKGPSSCWKGHKDWGGHVVPPSLDLTSTGLSLLSLSTSNEPDTRSCLENSGNWCQQQGTLPSVPPAGNWGSGMHKHPRMWGGQWRPGYCPQSARIPCDSHVLIPTYQDPKPEEDPAGHRERRVLVLRRCQDDPEADVDNSSEDVDGLGKDEGEGSQSRCCEKHPTPIPHHNAGKGLGQAPVPMSPALSRTIPVDPQSLEGRVSPPTPWDEPSGSLAFGMTSWQAQASGSPRPAGPPGDPWPRSPP